MSYRLLSYLPDKSSTTARAGILIGDRVYDLAAAVKASGRPASFDPATTLAVLDSWDSARPVLEAIAAAKGAGAESRLLTDTALAAPILYPRTLYCAAANYQDHFREMLGHDVDKSKIKPYFFLKVTHQAIIGTGGAILKPAVTQKLDWEAEIAVVIGKRARNVKVKDAFDYIAGYTIVNDLSARDFLQREDWPSMRSDWVWQKSFDTSAPMGPWITPRADIADPQNLKIETWVNDTLEQDTHSRFMIFTIAEQIEALSEHMTLLPGDVIATGTGAGVGARKNKYLNAGDKVRITIEGLGTIDNPVRAGQ
jgi:2-keto-4-pentenoate hydratase/2-oxohepta-3-ene-1,7-dioic acid hydratase in catechol pathway